MFLIADQMTGIWMSNSDAKPGSTVRIGHYDRQGLVQVQDGSG